MPKGSLTVVIGNTPASRGAAVDELSRAHPDAVLMAVSVHNRDSRYPLVQRFTVGAHPGAIPSTPRGATGDPAVIVHQDLMALRKAMGNPRVILALPDELDTASFVVELWRPRVGHSALEDHYEPAPIVMGLDPGSFLIDLKCVHQAQPLWDGGNGAVRMTTAEIAARQVEAADCVFLLGTSGGQQGVDRAEVLVRHLNPAVALHVAESSGAVDVPADNSTLLDAWRHRLEPIRVLRVHGATGHDIGSFVWRTRRPVHPQRLADALGVVMFGVLRSRGHLWLCSRPEAVVLWRSAGPHLELLESGHWLKEDDISAWQTASAQRRTMASWFLHTRFGERRNEIAFTGALLDHCRIRGALDAALLDDSELALGPQSWASVHDPLLFEADP
ncbi:GTP-binding protein [Streptomyces sp. NPDC046977]|uniref:GTP-binding protein n=1 Tax=Streptomyces sp. NPDC046977 TaxID=3154703 RepID=UPI00340FCC5C